MPGATERAPLPAWYAEVLRGVELFNRGLYFEAHEIIEEVWRPLPSGCDRVFLQGLIQVAVAMAHQERGRVASARTLLARARAKLVPLAPALYGFDLHALLRDLDAVEAGWAGPSARPARPPRIEIVTGSANGGSATAVHDELP